MEPTLISSPDVWMEGAATLQLERVASRPGCLAAVGMPDLHPGMQGPIGAALVFGDGAHPPLIGGDAGCGARLVGLPSTKSGGLDALERRVREVMEEPAVDIDLEPLYAAAWAHGARGLAALDELPDALRELALAQPEDSAPPSAALPEGDFALSLGTIGGGNHFLELSQVERVEDKLLAQSSGLSQGGLAILAHSGSRGLGKVMAGRWAEGPLLGDALEQWLGELRGLVRYASANRLLLVWKMLRAVGAARSSKIGGGFDVVHNTVVPYEIGGQLAWLHRKGAAPADQGQLTVVLGSRGAPSFVMEGLGATASLCSVAHGAGRKMTRTEATEKVKSKYSRASLSRTLLGGRVICDDTALLYEEHPDAYKPMDPVVEALVAHGAARRVAALRPLITVKK